MRIIQPAPVARELFAPECKLREQADDAHIFDKYIFDEVLNFTHFARVIVEMNDRKEDKW